MAISLSSARPPATLGHADYLGWWLSAAIFCAWALARVETGTWRRIGIAAATLAGTATVMSGTRSAMAAVGVALVYLALASRVRPRARHAAGGLAIVAVCAMFYISPAGEGLRARVHWTGDEAVGGARPLLWTGALRMAAFHPITGFGPETFSATFPHFQSLELARLVPEFYHESPHNVALDALTAEGIPGLLIALGWLGLGGFAVWRVRGRRGGLDAALGAALVACFIASLFNALTIGTAVATLTVIALLVARDTGDAREPSASGSALFRVAAVPVALALAAYAVVLLGADFRLERVRQAGLKPGGAETVARYDEFRNWSLPGASEDLYCSRQIVAGCAAHTTAIGRLECSHNALLAAARATSTADNTPNAWYNLAMFAAAQSDGRSAENALRSAISAAPNWFRPHWALANFLLLTGRKNEAISEIGRAELLSAGKIQEVADSRRKIDASR